MEPCILYNKLNILSSSYYLCPDYSVSLCRTHRCIAVGYREYVMNAKLIHIGAGVQSVRSRPSEITCKLVARSGS